MTRILIVDDEPSIVMAVKDELIFQGFEVDSASDGPGGIQKVREFRPDVLLLDLRLPGMNGFEVCKELRREMPELWIIMLSVRSQEIDRVLGLECADDYVTKPFSLPELLARIKVGLRRKGSKDSAPFHRFGDVEVDLRRHRVLKRKRELALTKTEFQILEMFLERAGKVITRDEFLDTVWGREVYVTPRVIDTHITSLRKKLEDDSNNPKYIQSVRGVGYKFDVN